MQKNISTLKHWISSQNKKITWRDNGPDGGLLVYIREEFMTYWCIDNLKNGGYSSDTSVPYII